MFSIVLVKSSGTNWASNYWIYCLFYGTYYKLMRAMIIKRHLRNNNGSIQEITDKIIHVEIPIYEIVFRSSWSKKFEYWVIWRVLKHFSVVRKQIWNWIFCWEYIFFGQEWIIPQLYWKFHKYFEWNLFHSTNGNHIQHL